MLRPGQPALDRETALTLLDELGERFERHRRARRLAAEMQRVLDEGERP